MPKSEAQFDAADIAQALGLLTRLPLPPARTGQAPRGARAAWAWPLAGLAVGLIGGAVAWAAQGLPPALAAGLALAAMVAATGALHEDGLADTADGLWGGTTPVRRLEIMKDSRIGSYGVLALVLGMGLRWAALAAILDQGAVLAPLVAAGVLSRAPMAALMHALPNARGSGLSALTGRPPRDDVLAGGLLAVLIGLVCLGGLVVPAILAAGGASLALGALARRKIGGQTGDILGAAQQVSEIAVLAVIAQAV